MKTRVLITTLILVSIFFGCKKKELPEAEAGNSPQFFFNGKVNGSEVKLEAGVNDYYMFSGYTQNSTTNVYGFKAALKQNNCSTCNNSLEIEINDWRQSSYNGPSGIDTAFKSNFYPYCTGTWAAVSYSMAFYPLFNNLPYSYLWDFGDGSTSASTIGTHIYEHAGEYNVSLTVVDQFSCSNTVSNKQTVGRTDNLCHTTITVTSTSTLNANYTHNTIGSGSYSFLWDFGDGNQSTVATPSHSYAAQGRYPVSLKVVDLITQDSATANINYVTAGSNTCTTNYVLYGDSAIANPLGYSNIVVKWTDSNGIVYTSNNASQPSDSYFKVISVSDYHTNETGQKTKKLHIRFKCIVYSSSASMPIENGEAVVVVAYK